MNFLDKFRNKRIYGIFDNDLDGVSCHIVSILYIQPICYQLLYTLTAKRDMSEYVEEKAIQSDIIIFADITPTVELYKHLTQDLKKEVYIFDHHIGPRDELLTVAHENYYFSNDKCGSKVFLTTITQNIRIKNCVYAYFEKVDIYDRWVDNSALWKEAKDLHNIMYGYVNWFAEESDDVKYDRFIDIQLKKFATAKYFYFTEYEKELALKAEKKERDNQIQAEKNLSIRTDNSKNKYAYFECSSKLSIVASNLMKKYLDIKYFVCHSTFAESAKGELNGKVSLRCREDFDVSVVAALWGGNGHKQASGAELKLEDFDKLRKGKMHLI